jgi:hypothetical protein
MLLYDQALMALVVPMVVVAVPAKVVVILAKVVHMDLVVRESVEHQEELPVEHQEVFHRTVGRGTCYKIEK